MGDAVLIGLNSRKLLCFIAIFVVLATLSFFVPEAKAFPAIVKVMPLGDSITVGYPGLDGYRGSLFLDLNNSGFSVDFVGSQKNGTGFDTDNEGHMGFEANQIRDGVISWLNSNPPDIVLLHIGTNDIQSGQNAADVVIEVAATLDKIKQWEFDNSQSVTVILASIVLRSDRVDWNDTTKSFDVALQAMAQARIANGDKIVVVDMENALNYSTDMSSDGIHPNFAGYEKMADVWYTALVKLLGYSLTINYDGHGLVAKLPDKVAYPSGAVVNLTAKADDGWTFSSWSGALSGNISSQNITMNSNKTVTANFNPMYKLTLSTNYGITAPSAGEEHWYTAGTNVTIVATPPTAGADERFTLLNWTGSGASSYNGTSNNVTITINSNVTETAFWTHEYKLTLYSTSGTSTPPAGEYWYKAGTPVTITAVSPTSADTRGSWTGWTGLGANSYTGTINPVVLTMNGPITETALWNTEYKLTVVTNLGTTQPAAGENWFAAGTSVNVETSPPTAQTGVQYVCSGWAGTGSVPATGNSSNVVFTINSPSSISWTWKTQYYLTVTSAYGNPAGGGWYDASTSAYASVNPTTSTGPGGTQYVFTGWSGSASGNTSPSNVIVMDGPKTATANWSPAQTSTPTPTPPPTPTPSHVATPTPSPTATSGPSETPFPTASASPSSEPTLTTAPTNSSVFLFIGLTIGVVSIVAVAVTVVALKMKKSQS